MAQERPITDDWWPEWMQDLASENPLASDPVVVAAVEATDAEHQRYRQLFTALAPVDTLDDLLPHPGGIGLEASSSGPHPSYSEDEWEYQPRFWVAGTAVMPESDFTPTSRTDPGPCASVVHSPAALARRQP